MSSSPDPMPEIPAEERTSDGDASDGGLLSAALGVCCGFSLLYVLALLSLPGPIYWPLERRWSLELAEKGLPMLYFRQLGWGMLGAGLGGLLGYGLGRGARIARVGWTLWMMQAGVLLALALLYSGFQAFTPLGKP